MKIFFATFGCKVNASENEFFLSQAFEVGYERTQSIESADLIIINGCAVTQTATQNVKSYISKTSVKNPNAKIIVTGCITPEIEGHLFNNIQIIPNNKKNDVIQAISTFSGGNILPHPQPSSFCGGLPDIGGSHTRAFFKIQDGCDAFCSYCIIPSLRGAPVSLPIETAVAEFEKCVKKGFKEIVLVGIHIGLYGIDKGYELNDLLRKLVEINGDFRIRLSSVEVNEINDELIQIISTNDKICNHLHIPLQSGSDKILKLMERKYQPEKYIETVIKAKSAIKDLNVGSDVIVGFPTESEPDFQDTVNCLQTAGTDFLHVFPYSDRKGTKASSMENKIDENTKEYRAKVLRQIGKNELKKNQEKNIGKIYRVLTEKNNKGHTANYFQVAIEHPEKLPTNEFMNIKISGIQNDQLTGKLN